MKWLCGGRVVGGQWYSCQGERSNGNGILGIVNMNGMMVNEECKCNTAIIRRV